MRYNSFLDKLIRFLQEPIQEIVIIQHFFIVTGLNSTVVNRRSGERQVAISDNIFPFHATYCLLAAVSQKMPNIVLYNQRREERLVAVSHNIFPFHAAYCLLAAVSQNRTIFHATTFPAVISFLNDKFGALKLQ